MFIGAGSYEIPDYTYEGPDQGHNALIITGCPRCHMGFSEDAGGHVVHNFMPDIEVCTVGCHVGATDFNINGVQDSVVAKLDRIAVLMGYTDFETLELTLDEDNLVWEACQREAVYGAVFVYNSGDLGVHNKKYAFSILDNAEDYLTNVCLAP